MLVPIFIYPFVLLERGVLATLPYLRMKEEASYSQPVVCRRDPDPARSLLMRDTALATQQHIAAHHH